MSHPARAEGLGKYDNLRSNDELVNDVLQWTPTHGHTSVDWPTKNTILSFVQTQDAVKIYEGWRLLGTNGERERQRERERPRER